MGKNMTESNVVIGRARGCENREWDKIRTHRFKNV